MQLQHSWLRNASALVYFRNDELSDYKDHIGLTVLVRNPISNLPLDSCNLGDDAFLRVTSTNPGLSLSYSSTKKGV